MRTVEQAISWENFIAIPRTKDAIKGLPKEIRICSDHGGEIDISIDEHFFTTGAGPPFGKAAFVGCCHPAIDRVRAALLRA